MSWTQQRTTESWNNDPNKFQNLNGPDAGFHDGLQQEGERGSFFPGGHQVSLLPPPLRSSCPTRI